MRFSWSINCFRFWNSWFVISSFTAWVLVVKFFQKISDSFFRINNIIQVFIRHCRNVFKFLRTFKSVSTDFKQESLLRIIIQLHLPAFWITRLFLFFNLHNDSNPSLFKLKDWDVSLLRTEYDRNAASCKRSLLLTKSTND